MTVATHTQALLLALLLGLAPGCRKRVSAEDQVREAIDSAAQGVRDRKVKKVAAIVSQQYADKEGHDRQAILGVLRAHILLRPNLYLVTRISSVVCEELGQCGVRMLAAMASVPTETLPDLVKLQADVYRFDLTLVDEDGSWRVRSAVWYPASAKDLL